MARLRRSRRIRRTRKGIEVSLPEEERELVGGLAEQLRELLLADEDPSLRRLYPTAHADDARIDDEYQSMVHSSLVEGRLAALDVLEATIDEKTLTDEQLGCWMGAVNDLRLVLGTRLDVSEEDHEIDPDAPDGPARLVYHYLGWLLEEIVTVMTEALPEPTAE